jgi:hypothetical protein
VKIHRKGAKAPRFRQEKQRKIDALPWRLRALALGSLRFSLHPGSHE